MLLDRFVDSSLAYQGAGRGARRRRGPRDQRVRHRRPAPDRTLLLRIDPAAGRARAEGRGEAPDRLEREGDAFFAAIAAAYDELAAAEPERIRVLDATHPPAALVDAALGRVEDLLPAPDDWENPLSVPDFQVESFEHVSATRGTVLLRVAGRWHSPQRERLSAPMLTVDDGSRTHRLAPLPGPDDAAPLAGPDAPAWRAAYSAPADLVLKGAPGLRAGLRPRRARRPPAPGRGAVHAPRAQAAAPVAPAPDPAAAERTPRGPARGDACAAGDASRRSGAHARRPSAARGPSAPSASGWRPRSTARCADFELLQGRLRTLTEERREAEAAAAAAAAEVARARSAGAGRSSAEERRAREEAARTRSTRCAPSSRPSAGARRRRWPGPRRSRRAAQQAELAERHSPASGPEARWPSRTGSSRSSPRPPRASAS